MDQFFFQSSEKSFGDGIVIAVPRAAHALLKAVYFQLFLDLFGSILAATITLKDSPYWRFSIAVGHGDSFCYQLCFHRF